MLLLEKKCSQCGRLLSTEMFHKDGGRLKSACRDCAAKRKKANAARANKASAQHLRKKKEIFNAVAEHSIYFIASPFKPEHVKIGYTSNIYRRINSFLNATSGDLLLLSLLQVNGLFDELPYHRKFQDLRIGDTEWFIAKSSLIQFVSSLDQHVARQSLTALTKGQQSRVVVPNIEHWIDSLPFL